MLLSSDPHQPQARGEGFILELPHAWGSCGAPGFVSVKGWAMEAIDLDWVAFFRCLVC